MKLWVLIGKLNTKYLVLKLFDKGAISDSLKRAAVSFGIGRHLYDLPSIWVKCQSKQVGSKYYFQRFTEDPWDKVRQSNSDFS